MAFGFLGKDTAQDARYFLAFRNHKPQNKPNRFPTKKAVPVTPNAEVLRKPQTPETPYHWHKEVLLKNGDP